MSDNNHPAEKELQVFEDFRILGNVYLGIKSEGLSPEEQKEITEFKTAFSTLVHFYNRLMRDEETTNPIQENAMQAVSRAVEQVESIIKVLNSDLFERGLVIMTHSTEAMLEYMESELPGLRQQVGRMINALRANQNSELDKLESRIQDPHSEL